LPADPDSEQVVLTKLTELVPELVLVLKLELVLVLELELGSTSSA
jgi:hypothetical protein